MTSLAERYARVGQSISDAASKAGRNAEELTLIVVTKNHPATLVAELIDLGARHFGENRDQEASPKAAQVAELRPAVEINWHFVGQLQSNKTKSVLKYAKAIHSLDRPSLLDALNKAQLPVEVFIELNLTSDANRGGIQIANLTEFAEAVLAIPHLSLRGVMGVAGLGEDPNREFERIREASAKLMQVAPAAKFISAGMSEDFEVAIAHGATHLRIGTAITGKRQI